MIARSGQSGQACDELAPGLRCFSVGNYVIFFRRTDSVQIIRVIHGARDIESLFQPPAEP